MFAKTVAALPLAASLASALSLHRHQQAHADADKRAIVWKTVYNTVYVTAGAEQPAQTQNFVQDAHPAPPVQTVNVEQTPQTTLATAVKPQITLPIIGDLLPSKASSADSPSSTGLGFAKRGIAYNDASMANAFKATCLTNCGWGYNWGSSPSGLDSNIPYVPMLWGDLPVHTANWHNDAEAAISKGSKAMLSFNEPDMPSQANMAPGAAAAAHAKYFAPYKGRAQIGSPAVSNSGQAGQGISWLKDFMTACNADSNCHVDFCAVHWYSEAQYSNTLFDHLKAANDACGGKPVWLTEFAPFGSDDQISGFMRAVVPKLDSLDYLHAYSYFMVAQNQLMSGPSLLSTIGNVYAALTN